MKNKGLIKSIYSAFARKDESALKKLITQAHRNFQINSDEFSAELITKIYRQYRSVGKQDGEHQEDLIWNEPRWENKPLPWENLNAAMSIRIISNEKVIIPGDPEDDIADMAMPIFATVHLDTDGGIRSITAGGPYSGAAKIAVKKWLKKSHGKSEDSQSTIMQSAIAAERAKK